MGIEDMEKRIAALEARCRELEQRQAGRPWWSETRQYPDKPAPESKPAPGSMRRQKRK